MYEGLLSTVFSLFIIGSIALLSGLIYLIGVVIYALLKTIGIKFPFISH